MKINKIGNIEPLHTFFFDIGVGNFSLGTINGQVLIMSLNAVAFTNIQNSVFGL